jgi:hypothetical protein
MHEKEAGRETSNNSGESEADPPERRVPVPSTARIRDPRDLPEDLRTEVDAEEAALIEITQTGVFATRNGKMAFVNEAHRQIGMDRIERRGGELSLENPSQGSRIMTWSSWRVM